MVSPCVGRATVISPLALSVKLNREIQNVWQDKNCAFRCSCSQHCVPSIGRH
jgi:hypothetical protein